MVAVNLLNYYLRKQVFGVSDNMPPLIDVIKDNIKNEVYDPEILKLYSEEEIDQLDNYVKHNRDYLFVYAGLQQLVDKYLSQNYSYFFNQNSSKFTKNIIVEVSRFSGNVVGSICHILIDLFVITTVLISLLFYQPFITIIIALFLIFIVFMLIGFSKNIFF